MKNKLHRLNFSIDADDHASVEKMANITGHTPTAFYRLLIKAYLRGDLTGSIVPSDEAARAQLATSMRKSSSIPPPDDADEPPDLDDDTYVKPKAPAKKELWDLSAEIKAEILDKRGKDALNLANKVYYDARFIRNLSHEKATEEAYAQSVAIDEVEEEDLDAFVSQLTSNIDD